jgi:thiol-disulfide isomerase/thioredoxin
VCLCTLLGFPALAFGQDKKLPEAWFFGERPAGLKGLEGKPPPELKLKTWIGDAVDVRASRGKVLVIDFWATWCGPCMAAVPENVRIANQYKERGLVLLGVHDANSGWERAPAVVKEKNINYSVALDEAGGISAKAFNLAFWPTYIIVDRAGIVRGAGLSPGHLEEAVKLLLAEPAPEGINEAAGNELPAEWFYGGLNRPAAFRALEGKPLPELTAADWLGEPLTAADTRERVLVLHFLASGNGTSMKQAEVLAALEREIGSQGVVFSAVCAADDSWETLTKIAGEGRVPSRLCHDAPAVGDQPAGATGAIAATLGLRYVPCTVLVDRAGVVRAAGVRVESVKEIAGKLLAESTPARRDGDAAAEPNQNN